MLGWLGRIAPLTTVLPGLAGMVFDTALCFVLLGAALLAQAAAPAASRLRRAAPVCAALALTLALLNVVQIASGKTLGINLPELHAWNSTGNPAPGQMSLPTTVCFILAGTSALLQRWRRRNAVVAIARVFSALTFAIGLLAVCGYLLKLEPLYSWYPMSQMAVHTAVGMLLLAAALWLSWSEPQREYREEREIVAVATTALVIVALLSALTGTWVLRTQGAETLNKNLQMMQQARANLLTLALDQRSARVALVGTQGSLLRAMRALVARPGDRAGRQALQRELSTILQRGFDGIVLLANDGTPLAAAGKPIPPPDLELLPQGPQPGRTGLAWRNGLVLRNRIELRDASGRLGELVVEHASPVLQSMLLSTAELGSSGAVALCGPSNAGPACLPGRDRAAPYLLQEQGGEAAQLMAKALDGASGTDHVAADQGQADMAAFGPVGASGLALMVQVNAAALYAPIRHGLLLGFVLVGLLVFAAAAWLRRHVGALAQRLSRANYLRETERRRQEEDTLHLAHHDSLTGLPNRTLLQQRMRDAIQRARRERGRVAVMMIDLDHFKRVNDSLGHHVGDQLLKTVAERILACVRGSDTVARMGGDEFVVLLDAAADDSGIERMAAAIIERIAAPIPVDGHELLVTPSIGISRYPDDGEDLPVLLMNADSAMYRAKAGGRQAYCLFSRDMQQAARNRMELEGALRQALKLGEFSLDYQPQISLINGEIIGMEALLRWNNPQRGAVSPADFIPVAEESGLIVEIGEWVLATACREARLLQLRTGRPLRLAVNLSPRQFRQAGLVEQVQRALREGGLAPEHLELEITEGVLMAQTAEMVQRLGQLRALGVSIAVDDFGVGFSSLAYITRFPISTLKIDRVFVSQLPDSANDAAVAQAIIALARSLNINVVAEGVETLRQLEYLRARNCDMAQGYHIGKPVPLAQFSVQGFHFGKAIPLEAFGREFEKTQRHSWRSVGAPG